MSNNIHETRRANLVRQLERSALKKSEFARQIGVSRSYLSQILSPGFRFGERAARTFEERLRLARGALDAEAGTQLGAVEVWDRAEDLPDGVFALVPRVAVELSAGGGSTVTDEAALPPLAFRADWLRKKAVTHRDNLRTCDVRGDSMSPYLEAGDIVLIDTGQVSIEDNQVYAIRYGDELRIKRLSRRFDGGLLIRSDNKVYPDEALTAAEAEQIGVIGKILWRGGGG